MPIFGLHLFSQLDNYFTSMTSISPLLLLLLVNWLRGEGFGSISIYIESQTFLTSIAVSPARIAKEYQLPNPPNWDII